jgi:hypothetical protein
MIVRQTATGEQLDAVRITNDPMRLTEEMGKAGSVPEMVLEATCGRYWAADVLAEAGLRVHLAHPPARQRVYLSADEERPARFVGFG